MKPKSIDVTVETKIIEFSQKMGRRSFIGKVGKFVFVLFGTSALFPILSERALSANCQGGHGSDCNADGKYCGMTGHTCAYTDKDQDHKCFCDGACPKGTTKGTYWFAECACTGGGSETINYYDCCGTVDPAYCEAGQSVSCSNMALRCNRSGVWCDGGGSYVCTIA